MGVGQFCTKPGLIFLQDSPESAALLETAATSLAAVAPGTMLHAGIRSHFQSSAARLAKVAGVTQKLAAPTSDTPAADCKQSALFFLTTADNLAHHPEIAEAVFRPTTAAIPT